MVTLGGEMLGKASTKNCEIYYFFSMKYTKYIIYMHFAQNKGNPICRSGKLKNEYIDRMLSDLIFFFFFNSIFKNIKVKKLFVVFVF